MDMDVDVDVDVDVVRGGICNERPRDKKCGRFGVCGEVLGTASSSFDDDDEMGIGMDMDMDMTLLSSLVLVLVFLCRVSRKLGEGASRVAAVSEIDLFLDGVVWPCAKCVFGSINKLFILLAYHVASWSNDMVGRFTIIRGRLLMSFFSLIACTLSQHCSVCTCAAQSSIVGQDSNGGINCWIQLSRCH